MGDTKVSGRNDPVTLKEIKTGDPAVVHATKKGDRPAPIGTEMGAIEGMPGHVSGMNMDRRKPPLQ